MQQDEEGFGRSRSHEGSEEEVAFSLNKQYGFKINQNAKFASKQQDRGSEKEKAVVCLDDLGELSVKFDILMGWKPQLGIKHPFPLYFPDKFSASLRRRAEFVFKGARPKHSYDLHMGLTTLQGYRVHSDDFRQFREAVSRGLIKHFSISAESKPDKLAFDSSFESGNLDFVQHSLVGVDSYDLYLRPDTSTRGHAQWFYFSVYAHEPVRAMFHIRNMSKAKSLFGNGGTPYFSFDNITWRPLEQASYYLSTFTTSEDCRPLNYRVLNTLQFSYMFKGGERIYFCYCPPYTLTKLQAYLDGLCSRASVRGLIKYDTLCQSLSGLTVPLLKVSEPTSEDTNLEPKPAVFVIARVHPGETCGSHMMQGFLDELLTMTESSKFLRKVFDFYIVPMVNPDGVVVGNFRTDLVGDDLNRQYSRPSNRFHPAVVALMRLVSETARKQPVVALFDLHGHSTKPGVFTYGPVLPKEDSLHSFARILPYNTSLLTEMFKFDKCSYSIPKSKMSTARAHFLFKKQVKLCYTVEASVGGYVLGENLEAQSIGRFEHFSIEGFEKVGRCLVQAWATTIRTGLQIPLVCQYLFGTNHNLPGPQLVINSKQQNLESIEQAMNRALLGTTGPDSEGGSDSESSDDDVGAKEKAKMLERLEAVLDRDLHDQVLCKTKPRKKKKHTTTEPKTLEKLRKEQLRVKTIKGSLGRSSNAKENLRQTVKDAEANISIGTNNQAYDMVKLQKVPFGSAERRFGITNLTKPPTEKRKITRLSSQRNVGTSLQREKATQISSSNILQEPENIKLSFHSRLERPITPLMAPPDPAITWRGRVMSNGLTSSIAENIRLSPPVMSLAKIQQHERFTLQPVVSREVKVSHQILDGEEFLRLLKQAQDRRPLPSLDDLRRLRTQTASGWSTRRNLPITTRNR